MGNWPSCTHSPGATRRHWQSSRTTQGDRADREICKKVIDDIEARQDRDTGDYSRFWDERDYVQDASKVRAAVFVVHGLNDWNVKTKQSVQWWNALARDNVPRKLWLHQATG